MFKPHLIALLVLLSGAVQAKNFSLHPENPHYFLFRGKPVVLITSAEHYGAVVNLDFDFIPYLNELKARKLNHTRIFSGAYVEPQGAFNIAENTLAPAPNRFIAPWARSSTPGYASGGNKFDLNRWDSAYFRRLKDFVSEAGKRGIVVEVNLFCPFYEEPQWSLSPQNPKNNINGMSEMSRTNVYTLDKHGGLLPVHETLVRKIVSELRGYDNLYYEICNEPYFGGVTMEWQHHIADVITEAQEKFKDKHLISQNIANGSAKIQNPHPQISIFNFHYASPPTAVGINYSLNKAIGDNETGFRGTNDLPYRVEAWDFILAGGALYNNLDYSFTASRENGTFAYPSTQPGGGSPAFRSQMTTLADFINGFDFVKMRPENLVIKGGVPPGSTARALAEPGKAYAIYIAPAPAPKDEYSVRWTGAIQPKFSETYTFHTVSNDGVRLAINKKPVIDNWTAHSDKEDSGAITLQAGVKYEIVLDYYQNGGGSVIKLMWSSPSQPKEVVPAASLSSRGAEGLEGKYYLGNNFGTLRLTRMDPVIDFSWTGASPFAEPGKESLATAASLSVDLGAGAFTADWINPVTGKTDKTETFTHAGGVRTMISPPYREDMALRIRKKAK